MPRNKDEPPAVRVYTVCDESRYLIVRNVPALGCGDELLKLFGSYGEIEEYKPLDDEDCEPFTDVYWIKFLRVSNARFAKKKLDESVFFGNKLQVSYAPHFESLSDTKEKLEGRKKEVLARLNPRRSQGSVVSSTNTSSESFLAPSPLETSSSQSSNFKQRECKESQQEDFSLRTVSSDKEYFSSPSMNETVRFVREKLNKIYVGFQQKKLYRDFLQLDFAPRSRRRNAQSGRDSGPYFTCSFAPMESTKIEVVGVGGGNNAVNRMIGSGLQNLPQSNDVEEEYLDEDAIEALFSQLEEDLKNDNLSVDGSDDEISEEDLNRLESELEEALRDDDEISDLFNPLSDTVETAPETDEEEEEEQPMKLKKLAT